MILDFGFNIDEWAELATDDNLRVKIVGCISLDGEIWYFVAGPREILAPDHLNYFQRFKSNDIPPDWIIDLVEADALEPILSKSSHLGVV